MQENEQNKDEKNPETQTPQPSPDGPIPARSPGRPPKMRVDSVNISTDLELDERFIKFCKLANIQEPKGLLTVIALYKYATRHCAADGNMSEIPYGIISERTYWGTEDDEPHAKFLIECLINSKILTKDLTISDWCETQPHAIKRAHNLKYYQKQQDTGSKTISDNFSAEKSDIGCREAKRREEKRSEKQKTAFPHPPAFFNPAPQNSTNVKDKLKSLALKMAQTFNLLTNSNEMNMIYQNLTKITNATSYENAESIAEQIQTGYANGRIKKPVAVLIKETQKYE